MVGPALGEQARGAVEAHAQTGEGDDVGVGRPGGELAPDRVEDGGVRRDEAAGGALGTGQARAVELGEGLVWVFLNNFKQKNEKNYLIFIFLSLIPLLSVKMGEITHYSPFGFLGISYMSFKTVQMIIEINDGLIDTVKFSDFILFMIYFPTISSGPITRSRDFEKNINSEITKEKYKDYLGDGLLYLLSGLVYKIVISHYLYGVLGTVQGGFLIRNLK